MRDKFNRFWSQYRLPMLLLLLLLIAVPAGAWMTARQFLGHFPELLQSTETRKDITASAMTESPTEPTAAVLTEPETEPTTQPATQASTAPPTTESPESALIDNVPFYSQRKLLPTGCELVSAKMVLEYYTGEEIPIREITDRAHCQYPQTIDGKPCAPHPSQAFIGDPWDPTSYGCFAGVVCEMMNELLPDGYTAVETSGTPVAKLAETYIPHHQPVLLWVTIAMIDSYPHGGWYLTDKDGNPTDEWYEWLASEHCAVLIGYDDEYYYFNDPYSWQGCTKYRRDLVERRYEEIGGYSAVVLPDKSTEPTENAQVK